MTRYARVENRTRSSVLAERCRVARSFWERMVGLLGSPEPQPGDGLLIERAQSIHTWFMRYPIDVVFVDRQRRVTRTAEHLRPWRTVLWARGARDCIELRTGSIARSGTRPGDVLEVTEVP